MNDYVDFKVLKAFTPPTFIVQKNEKSKLCYNHLKTNTKTKKRKSLVLPREAFYLCYNYSMDRDYLIDLAISITQDCASEWHDYETVKGIEKELSEIDPIDMPELYDKVSTHLAEEKEDWLDGVKLRRYKMDVLGAKSPAYNYRKRCTLKHRATAFVTAVETYQADPDASTRQIMEWSEKRFWKALCQFMGVEEITDCGRCLSDQLNIIHAREKAAKNAAENGYYLDS